MKTFLIVAQANWDEHLGEEYDSILEVDNEVILERGKDGYGAHLTPIDEWHNRIRGRIRKLWSEDATSEGADREEDDPRSVSITLDAASPFNAMLIDLRIVMKQEEGIIIELPYLGDDDGVPTTNDPETLELIDKLDNR